MNKRIFLTLGLLFLSSRINSAENKNNRELTILKDIVKTAIGNRKNDIEIRINNLENNLQNSEKKEKKPKMQSKKRKENNGGFHVFFANQNNLNK